MVYYMFLQIKSVMFKLSRRELHNIPCGVVGKEGLGVVRKFSSAIQDVEHNVLMWRSGKHNVLWCPM